MSTSQILIYSIPFISAIVCWFTNWLAVKMLFRPLHPIKIGPFVLHGILPKQQDKLALKIGEMFAHELFISQDIKLRVQHQDNIDKFIEIIEDKINYYLDIDFPLKYPITSIFFGRSRRKKIKQDLLEQVERQAPDIIENVMAQLEDNVKMEAIITDRVTAISTHKIEDLLNSTLKKDLFIVGGFAGVIGFFIGLLQVFLIEFYK